MKLKNTSEKVTLMAPLFLAFVWMGVLILDLQSANPDIRLSPGSISGMVTALFTFIIGYALVLVYLFRKWH
ncbi:hypothetical protein GOV09_06700 [Candidatus Woesearchaeota archaeon]|nr:hypothetical protein [Candidatus Woesearchaeota archaeon]